MSGEWGVVCGEWRMSGEWLVVCGSFLGFSCEKHMPHIAYWMFNSNSVDYQHSVFFSACLSCANNEGNMDGLIIIRWHFRLTFKHRNPTE